MTKLQSTMRWTGIAALASLILMAVVGIANAGNEDNEKHYWQERYSQLISGITGAERRIEQSRAAYSKAKQRDRLQGVRKQEIMAEVAAAESELARLKKELADFPEDARQAGVPPGWLREVEDRS